MAHTHTQPETRARQVLSICDLICVPSAVSAPSPPVTTTVSSAGSSISVVVATASRTLLPRIVPWKSLCATAVRTSSLCSARMPNTQSIWCGSADSAATWQAGSASEPRQYNASKQQRNRGQPCDRDAHFLVALVVFSCLVQSLLRALPQRQSDGESSPQARGLQAVCWVSDARRYMRECSALSARRSLLPVLHFLCLFVFQLPDVSDEEREACTERSGGRVRGTCTAGKSELAHSVGAWLSAHVPVPVWVCVL